jgi:hydrophobic/amphiphilic exporter-1 (mainly G- bacteria), HAE1 family
MTGLVGRIFREFAVTIIVAILASGIVSLTLTPLMCARMLGQRGHGNRRTLMERGFGAIEKRVLAGYGRSLWFFLRHKWVSAMIWLVCLAGTGWLLYSIPKSFLPVGDSGFLLGVLIGQEGASPKEMQRFQNIAEDVMHHNDAVETTFTMTGATKFLPSNYGFLIAFLKEKGTRPPIQQVAGQLSGAMAARMPGAIGVLNPQPVLSISTGATATQNGQYAYTLSGTNPDEVYAAARRMMGKMNERVGTMFAPPIIPDLYTNTPNLKIDILRREAATYGISASRVESVIRNAYSQNYVYLIKKTDDQFQVIIEAQDADRNQPEDLEKLYVRSDDGKNMVPLKAVATWKPVLGLQSVNHTNQFTSVTLNFNLVPGVTIGQATDYIDSAAREVVPVTVRSQFQGEALTFRDTVRSLMILMVLAVFVMYVILGVLYESFVHPITVLSTLPTAMVGGLATLFLFGQEASLYAFIGLFMLMGIVKKNGIMIVDFAVHRVNAGENPAKAIHDASMDRFRPILMTTLAAIMGAVPIALGYGADGEGRRPLGLVIVGGLIVSQLITLYVTPVIYLYMELFQEKVLYRVRMLRPHETEDELAADGVQEHGVPRPVLAVAGPGNGNGH